MTILARHPGVLNILRLVVAVLFGVLCMMDSAPVIAQTPKSVVITKVFTTDLNDIHEAALPALKDAVKEAKSGSKDGCYPPMRVELATVADSSLNPSLQKALADARAKTFIQALGLKTDQVDVTHLGGKDDTAAKITLKPPGDKDPPILKVGSQPPHNSKVKPGDKIVVTMHASERYADGHKSGPSGVLSLQLIADDGLVEPTGEWKPPQPCEPQSLKVIYTVPRKPPPIVHLRAIAEDGFGNKSDETAEFPTGDVWKGTLKGDAALTVLTPGSAYMRTCKDRWLVDVTAVVAFDRSISGYAVSHRASKPQCSPHPWAAGETRKSTKFLVHGKADDRSLHLQFQFTNEWDPPSSAGPLNSVDVTGFNAVIGRGSQSAIDVSIVNPKEARGSFEQSMEVPPSSPNTRYSSSGNISLTCTTC